MIRLKKVVFPEPFGPMMAFIAPLSTSRLTSLTAVSPSNFFVSPRVLRMNSFVEDNTMVSWIDMAYLKMDIPRETDSGE